jgi:hypothetical protein
MEAKQQVYCSYKDNDDGVIEKSFSFSEKEVNALLPDLLHDLFIVEDDLFRVKIMRYIINTKNTTLLSASVQHVAKLAQRDCGIVPFVAIECLAHAVNLLDTFNKDTMGIILSKPDFIRVPALCICLSESNAHIIIPFLCSHLRTLPKCVFIHVYAKLQQKLLLQISWVGFVKQAIKFLHYKRTQKYATPVLYFLSKTDYQCRLVLERNKIYFS